MLRVQFRVQADQRAGAAALLAHMAFLFHRGFWEGGTTPRQARTCACTRRKRSGFRSRVKHATKTRAEELAKPGKPGTVTYLPGPFCMTVVSSPLARGVLRRPTGSGRSRQFSSCSSLLQERVGGQRSSAVRACAQLGGVVRVVGLTQGFPPTLRLPFPGPGGQIELAAGVRLAHVGGRA